MLVRAGVLIELPERVKHFFDRGGKDGDLGAGVSGA